MRPERGWLSAVLAGLIGGAVVCAAGLIATFYHLGLVAEFQTLITGILAVFATIIALGGVLIQTAALHADRERQINFKKQKDREVLNIKF